MERVATSLVPLDRFEEDDDEVDFGQAIAALMTIG